VERKTPYLILLFTILTISFLLIIGGCSKRIPQVTDDAQAFKVLRAKMTDPKA